MAAEGDDTLEPPGEVPSGNADMVAGNTGKVGNNAESGGSGSQPSRYAVGCQLCLVKIPTVRTRCEHRTHPENCWRFCYDASVFIASALVYTFLSDDVKKIR